MVFLDLAFLLISIHDRHTPPTEREREREKKSTQDYNEIFTRTHRKKER